MVAYKKLNKEERVRIAQVMSSNLYNKSEAKTMFEDLEKEYDKTIKRHIPEELTEMHKKYPKSFLTRSYNLSTRYFVEKRRYNPSIFDWPYFKSEDMICGFLSENLNNTWYNDYKDVVDYLSVENLELLGKIENELIPKLKEIDKFANDLLCTLQSINTVNQLKEEIPEAYDIYVEKFGEPQKSSYSRCKTGNTKMCDSIEKLRATYSTVKSK